MTNQDHERIYLQPECCADPETGRLWCQHDAPEDCDDGVAWTEYVRADLKAEAAAATLQAMGYTIEVLTAENESLIAEYDKRLVAIQPEPASNAVVDDLSALVGRLAHALKNVKPGHRLAEGALDYLKRKGLEGSPLRTSEQVSKGDDARLGDLMDTLVLAAYEDGYATAMCMPNETYDEVCKPELEALRAYVATLTAEPGMVQVPREDLFAVLSCASLWLSDKDGQRSEKDRERLKRVSALYSLSPAQPDAPKTCAWWDDGSGIWESACGVTYEFIDGGPVENGHTFCNRCGLRVDAPQPDTRTGK